MNKNKTLDIEISIGCFESDEDIFSVGIEFGMFLLTIKQMGLDYVFTFKFREEEERRQMVKQLIYALNFLDHFESMAKKAEREKRKLDPDAVLEYIKDLRNILYGKEIEEVDSDVE